MKNILFVLVGLLSVQAFATKARIASLGNSFHVNDPQSIYSNPLRVIQYSNLVLIESGVTAATSSTDNAEGAVFFNINDTSRMAVSFGSNNDLVQNGRKFTNSIVGAATYSTPQNMVHTFYGVKDGEKLYTMGLFYSNSDDKLNGLTDSSSGFLLGYKNGSFAVFGSYALVNAVEAAAGKTFEGGGALKLSGRYNADDMAYGVDVGSWTNKSATNTVENEAYGNKSISLRVIKSIKKDGNEVFYGAGIMSNTIDCKTQASATCSTKFSSLILPVIVGIEANAADWLTLRGAITQSLPISTVKDEIGLPATATSGITGASGAVGDLAAQPNTTTLALGAGIKFNKITIDGSLGTATTQAINATALMTQVGLTYNY
ncbi:MAG: hypothetical protein ABL930_02670 [Pseudobdellovibrio sp.]